MIKVGLIGAGFMAKTHSEVYKALTTVLDVTLSGVADVRAENAHAVAVEHDAKVYDNAEAMIADPKIDVIDICAPTFLHAKYAKMAMEAGKAVFIEKPVTLTPKEGDMLLEVQEKTGAFVMVGQCIRMWDAYVYLKKHHDEKNYGALKHLVLRRLNNPPSWSWEDWYLDDEKSGGAILDLHIHDVDFMLYLLGEPDSMISQGEKGQVFTLCNYPNNTTVFLEGGWDYPSTFPFQMYFKACFEAATMTYENGVLTVFEDDKEFVVDVQQEDKSLELGGNISNLGAYFTELHYFFDCLINGKENTIAPLSAGVASVKMVYREIAAGNLK